MNASYQFLLYKEKSITNSLAAVAALGYLFLIICDGNKATFVFHIFFS
jgi:hypothetical protein